jgi:hypothetical protein
MPTRTTMTTATHVDTPAITFNGNMFCAASRHQNESIQHYFYLTATTFGNEKAKPLQTWEI